MIWYLWHKIYNLVHYWLFYFFLNPWYAYTSPSLSRGSSAISHVWGFQLLLGDLGTISHLTRKPRQNTTPQKWGTAVPLTDGGSGGNGTVKRFLLNKASYKVGEAHFKTRICFCNRATNSNRLACTKNLKLKISNLEYSWFFQAHVPSFSFFSFCFSFQ